MKLKKKIKNRCNSYKLKKHMIIKFYFNLLQKSNHCYDKKWSIT